MSIAPSGMPYWRLSGFYFLFFATFGVYMPYWSLYLKSIGFNALQIGVLLALAVVTKIFSSYLWGCLVDRQGERMPIIRFTAFMTFLVFAATLLVQDFWGLVVIIILFAMFWHAALPQIEAATLSYLGKSVHIYTIVRIWGSVGFIIAVWGFGNIFEVININYVPIILLFAMILVWLLTLTIAELPVTHNGQANVSLGKVLKQPKTIALLVSCFLMLVSHGPYYTFYSIYLDDYGFSKSLIGKMWALGVIAEVLIFTLMHRLLRYFRLRSLLLISLFMAVVRWLMIAFFVDDLLLLGVAQLLHAATFGMHHAVAIQYVHHYFKGELQGRGQGLYSSVSYGAGFAVGSLLAGLAWERVGATACLIGASVSALMGLIVVWLFIPHEEQSIIS